MAKKDEQATGGRGKQREKPVQRQKSGVKPQVGGSGKKRER